MSDYNSLKNAGLTTPTGNLDLGSATNRYGNIFLQGNLAIGNLVANENTLVSPKISSLTYAGDDTAANPAGAQTITINGSGFVTGAAVYVAGSVVNSVSVINSGQVTFLSPAKSAGNYTLLLVNNDGGTATFIPGMQYSGVPSWSTSSGSLANVYETDSVTSTLSATSDSPVTYAITLGSLPSGVTLTTSTGEIAGTAPSQAFGSTTYSFTASAIDGENQDTPRNFSVTVNADAVTWSSPADNTTYQLAQDSPISTISLSATSAAGKAITYTANSLPTGLSISGSSIVGTPTVIANTSSTLTATASGTGKSATRTINWVISLAADTNFKNVTLLLSGDGSPNAAQNNTFLDSSINNYSITRSGNVAQGTFTPFSQTGWSVCFDGTGDYLTTTGFGLPANFTLEFWSYLTAQPSSGHFTSASSSGPIISIETLKTILGQNGGYFLNPPNDSSVYPNGVSPLNQWNHWAVVRSSGTITFYLNGIRIGLAANSVDYTASQTFGIGAANNGTPVNVPHYMSNFRFSSVARYSGTSTTVANFTLPTADFVSDADTIFLGLQSNRFKDSGPSNRAITVLGDSKIVPFSPFAPINSYSTSVVGGSAYFDGSGDKLVFPTASAPLLIGTGQFTIEFWIYPYDTTFRNLVNWGDTYSHFRSFQFNGGLQLWIGPSQLTAGGGGMQTNAWNHIVIQRNATTLTSYVNGTRDYNAANADNFSDGTLTIGDGFLGYFSGFKYTKGSAVYSGTTITVPTTPPSPTGSIACVNFTNAGIIDSSSKNDIETIGNAQVNTSIKKYGTGSMYFDGAGDNLYSVANGTNNFSTGDFTIECWINFSVVGNGQIISAGAGSVTNAYYWQYFSNQLQFGIQNVSNILASNWTPIAETWYHIAVTRSGTNVRQFVGGTQLGTTVTSSQNFVDGPTYVGYGGAGYLNVYIDDLRVTKGVARYTANFTPPTDKFLAK